MAENVPPTPEYIEERANEEAEAYEHFEHQGDRKMYEKKTRRKGKKYAEAVNNEQNNRNRKIQTRRQRKRQAKKMRPQEMPPRLDDINLKKKNKMVMANHKVPPKADVAFRFYII